MVLTALPLFGAGAGAPTGDDLAACATPGQVQIRKDGWARIRSPLYGADEGDRKVSAFAVPATQNGWVYVTNGSVVQLSTSAGCKWDHIYPTPSEADAVPGKPRPRVVSELVAPAPTGLWVVSYDEAGGVAHPHVERSLDATPSPGNRTKGAFQAFDNGLPTVGRPLHLAVSEVNTDQAYLLVDTTLAAGEQQRRVYRTSVDPNLSDTKLPDTTWAELTLPPQVASPDGIEVAPTDSATLWVWSRSAFAMSRDRGATWKVGTAGGPIGVIDVDGTARAAVFSREREQGAVTFFDENMVEIGDEAVPVDARLAGHARRYGAFAVAGERGTWGYDVNHKRWTPIHPAGVAPFERMEFGSSATGGILLGQSGGDLYRFDLYAGDAFLKPPKGRPVNDVNVNARGTIATPTLRVQKHEVTVAPTKTVPDDADFGMPPSPVPLDVFFLMDTTDSMGTAIDGLKKGVKNIAENLKERTHGSACFGVGDVKDESIVHNGSTTLAPYTLVQPITCDLEEMRRGVDKLTESGGNQTEAEAQTIALTQAVTGKGQVQPPAVLPGQDAHFTAPTRVIVLITDAAFMQGTSGGYTFPTIKDTIKTLNAYHDTKVVGVVVHTGNDYNAADRDVTQVVEGTHTYAPAGGVDCDGIGGPEIAEGMPLVCDTENEAPLIEPAIVSLLLNIKDPGTMANAVDDPHHVVARIDGTMSRIVDLKHENHLPYRLHLTCSAAQDGQDLPVKLRGAVRGESVVTDEIVVHCRAPKIVVPPPPPKPPRPPLPPDPEPPIVPRQPIVVPILPQPQPPVNNPPNNLNPNAGLSQEEQEQFQLAAVGQDASESTQEDEEVELAMTGLPSPEDRGAAALLLGSATFVSAAAAGVWASRRRTQRSLRTAYARR